MTTSSGHSVSVAQAGRARDSLLPVAQGLLDVLLQAATELAAASRWSARGAVYLIRPISAIVSLVHRKRARTHLAAAAEKMKELRAMQAALRHAGRVDSLAAIPSGADPEDMFLDDVLPDDGPGVRFRFLDGELTHSLYIPNGVIWYETEWAVEAYEHTETLLLEVNACIDAVGRYLALLRAGA